MTLQSFFTRDVCTQSAVHICLHEFARGYSRPLCAQRHFGVTDRPAQGGYRNERGFGASRSHRARFTWCSLSLSRTHTAHVIACKLHPTLPSHAVHCHTPTCLQLVPNPDRSISAVYNVIDGGLWAKLINMDMAEVKDPTNGTKPSPKQAYI